MFNLLRKDIRILRVVANVDVSGASEPRLVSGDNLRTSFRRGNLRTQRLGNVSAFRSRTAREEEHRNDTAQKKTKLNTSCKFLHKKLGRLSRRSDRLDENPASYVG